MKIGVFGGTFNPIHFGHLRAAEEARETLGLDRVLFIPAGNPPLKSGNIAGAEQRFEMVRTATEGNRFFEVLDIECNRPGKSYIVETLETLARRYENAELHFMLGIDAFLDIPNWCRPGQITSMVDFIILSRPGRAFRDLLASAFLEPDENVLEALDSGSSGREVLRLTSGRKATLMRILPFAISSTDIRRRLQAGQSAKYLLPEQVESFIISHGLYEMENE